MATWPLPPVDVEGVGRTVHNEALEQNARDFAKRCLDAASRIAHAAGIACETVQAVASHPHQAIVQKAKANRCDVIVMASNDCSGSSAVLLGSEAQKLPAHNKVVVLVCRRSA